MRTDSEICSVTISARASGSRRALSFLWSTRVARAAHEADRVVPQFGLCRWLMAHPRLQGVEGLPLRFLGLAQGLPGGHVEGDRLAGLLVAHLGLIAFRRFRGLFRVARQAGSEEGAGPAAPAARLEVALGQGGRVRAVRGVVGAQRSEPLARPLKGLLDALRGDHLRVPDAGARVHDGEDGVARLPEEPVGVEGGLRD